MFHKPSHIHSSRICTFARFPRICDVGACAAEHREWERSCRPVSRVSARCENSFISPYLTRTVWRRGCRWAMHRWLLILTRHPMLRGVARPFVRWSVHRLLVRRILRHLLTRLRPIWRVRWVSWTSLGDRGIYWDVMVRMKIIWRWTRLLAFRTSIR